MAHIYKRGKYYWIKYSQRGKSVQKSLGITTKPPSFEGRLLVTWPPNLTS